MERNYMLETATCPHCGATCLNGHDDDGHIYCAKCRQSFVPQELTKITDEEYRAFVKKAEAGEIVKHECSGWTAFAAPIK